MRNWIVLNLHLNLLLDSLNNVLLWNFLQYHLNTSCRKLRVHQTTRITIDSRITRNRNVIDDWCRRCMGVTRSECDVLKNWCRYCIGVFRRGFDHWCRRCMDDRDRRFKNTLEVCDNRCGCHTFVNWCRSSSRGADRPRHW